MYDVVSRGARGVVSHGELLAGKVSRGDLFAGMVFSRGWFSRGVARR